MMSNDTASSSTDFSMARHVTSYPADNCAFDASLRLGSVRECEAQQGGTNDQTFHEGPSGGYDYCWINLGSETLFRPNRRITPNLMFL